MTEEKAREITALLIREKDYQKQIKNIRESSPLRYARSRIDSEYNDLIFELRSEDDERYKETMIKMFQDWIVEIKQALNHNSEKAEKAMAILQRIDLHNNQLSNLEKIELSEGPLQVCFYCHGNQSVKIENLNSARFCDMLKYAIGLYLNEAKKELEDL